MELLLAERDRYYNSKFAASELSVTTALSAAEKSVASAFLAQQTAMQAALAAADRANLKAEVASERRFEALNELRAMVADQQATFMQRLEAVALLNGLDEKIISAQNNYDAKLEALRASLDKSLENVSNEIASLHVQMAQSVSRSEFTIAKDQAAQSAKSSLERAVQNVTRTEFDLLKDLSSNHLSRQEFLTANSLIEQNTKVFSDRLSSSVSRDEFNSVQRMVYIGLGILTAVEFLFKFIVK